VLPGNGVRPLARRIVLVVEDDHDLRRIFRDTLKFSGFDVREASDGTDALRMIEHTAPDLVVLDVRLPTLDGGSVRGEMAANERTRHIPVVVVTGSNIDLSQFKGDRVLRKPVAPDELLFAVRSTLAAR
jgi:two-component system, OmpR family, response regulator